MARSCACDRWLTRAASDIGFHALPPLAQLLWFRLLAAAISAEEAGHLRFPCLVADAVSRLLNRTVTEAETDLAALADLGWIEADADGRGLWMVGAKARNARAEAARLNGLRGGAPRKGEGKEAYRERRQGNLMLPMAGGAGETQETQAEPNGESSRTAAKPIAIEAKQAAVRETAEWVSLGEWIADQIGLDPANGKHSYQPVKGWMDAGASAELIREVVQAKVARASGKIRAIGYFRDAVMEAMQRDAPPAPLEDSGYHQACREWQRNGAQGAPPTLEAWRARQAAA